MGLFERLGEKVERVKQEVDSARTGSANYRCRACETLIYSDLEACPECGSDDLESNESTSEGADGSTTAGSDEPAAESVESPSGTSDEPVESSAEGSDDVPSDEPVESLIADADERSKEEAADPATEE